jgi:integrase
MQHKTLRIIKNPHGLRIFCSKCQRQYYHHNIHKCSHPRNQKYKSLVSDGIKRRAVSFTTRSLNEALISARQFKESIKNPTLPPEEPPTQVALVPITIQESATLYMNFKHGIDVPEHLRKDYSTKYKKYMVFAIKQFTEVLTDKGVNINKTPVSELSDIHVGYWYSFIVKSYSEGSYDSPLKVLRPFIQYVIEELGVVMRNPFLKVQFDVDEPEIRTVSAKEFSAVINAVGVADPIQILGKNKERKNLYKPYLKDAFKIGVFSGLRTAEIAHLKFSDIKWSDKMNGYLLEVENRKVVKFKKTMKQKSKKPRMKIIPIGIDLMEVLVEMGFEQMIGEDVYVIDSERKVKPQTVTDSISKGFSHYYRACFPDALLQFKSLRKVYLSFLRKTAGGDTHKFSDHSDEDILDKHYIDPEIALRVSKSRVFG